MYTGGNPTFDPATATTMDRYEYILSQNPDRPWNTEELSNEEMDSILAWYNAKANSSDPAPEVGNAESFNYFVTKYPDRPWLSKDGPGCHKIN